MLLPDLTTTQRWCGFFLPGFGSFLVGDILGPVWYRKGLDISEVVILVSLIFWFSVWGGVGAVLAVPIMCTAKIVLEEIPHTGTHAIARMMAPSYAEYDDRDDSDEVESNGGSVATFELGASRRWRRHPTGWLEWGWTKVRRSRWYANLTGRDEPRERRAEGDDVDDDEYERRRPLVRDVDDGRRGL